MLIAIGKAGTIHTQLNEIIHDVPGGSPIPTKLPICFGGRVSMCVRCGKVKFHR